MKNSDVYAKRCSCGAITIQYTNDEGEQVNISMKRKKFNELFPETKLQSGLYTNCNHCVNHWGIDLCGCGSGKPVGKCNEGYHECKNDIASQEFNKPKTYALWN